MALSDDIAADQSAVEAAQAALDAANARLADDKAKLDALQPHVGAMARIEAAATSAEESVRAEIASALADLKALLGL